MDRQCGCDLSRSSQPAKHAVFFTSKSIIFMNRLSRRFHGEPNRYRKPQTQGFPLCRLFFQRQRLEATVTIAPLTDDFIFSRIMQNTDVCKEVLELLLKIKISHIEFPVTSLIAISTQTTSTLRWQDQENILQCNKSKNKGNTLPGFLGAGAPKRCWERMGF